MPLKIGDANATVAQWRSVMNQRFGPLYTRDNGPLPTDTNVFGARAQAWQQDYQRRTGQAVTGVVSDNDLRALGISFTALPVFFTVEGHDSDMFHGPVADTATLLESEGRCHHEPTYYNNGAVPFDNASGVRELARRMGQTTQDNGVDFAPGTKSIIGAFSQGAIVLYDFFASYLQPGQALALPGTWSILGFLVYGNPNRATDSIAPWAVGQITKTGTHGLDPYKRYGLTGCPAKPANMMDDYREGDIFAENGDDQASQMKAAVYQAVARGNLFGGTTSLLTEIAATYKQPLVNVVAIFEAIISGISFLADQPNPHYSPYDIGGGVDWCRGLLQAA